MMATRTFPEDTPVRPKRGPVSVLRDCLPAPVDPRHRLRGHRAERSPPRPARTAWHPRTARGDDARWWPPGAAWSSAATSTGGSSAFDDETGEVRLGDQPRLGGHRLPDQLRGRRPAVHRGRHRLLGNLGDVHRTWPRSCVPAAATTCSCSRFRDRFRRVKRNGQWLVDQTFRLILALGMAAFLPVALYHLDPVSGQRARSSTRRQEGVFILFTLRSPAGWRRWAAYVASRPQPRLDGLVLRAAARCAALGRRGDRSAHRGARHLDVPQSRPEHHRHRRHQTRAHADNELVRTATSVTRSTSPPPLAFAANALTTANWFIALTGFACPRPSW